MIPILYEGTETSFTSNGLGRLSDAITCKVTEERNASYELEMTYPVTGIHYDDIQENRIILAQPFEGGTTQPFQIYKITKPINGIVTVNAEHISYRLNSIVVMPFEATTATAALAGIEAYSSTTNPFEFTTDKSVTASFSVDVPTSARALLCGQSGSVLDVFGTGDYEFDRFDVNLWVNRGADNGVYLRYGKNITDLKAIADMTNVYTGICPYWADGEGTVVTLSEKVVLSDYVDQFPYKIIKSVDFSSDFESQPTEDQLRAKAQSYVENNQGWNIKNNITVSFVALWNTEEYADIAPLERVKMCDTVHIVYSPFGVDVSAKVIRTEYNVLLERYNAITLGDSYYSLNSYFNEELETAQEEQTSHMQKAIARATALIQGGLGGYVVMNTNSDGQPQEILIMDTDDISTAVNVIRMNMNGIGFSTSGYNGPFNTAWTIDGHFVADYIDTGTLNADLIKAGTIEDEAGLNYWNMETGDFRLTSAYMNGYSVANTNDVSTGDATTLASANSNTSSAISAYDTSLTQTKVFNKLTNNGSAQGIYMSNGQLYINATYLASGIIADTSGNTSWNLSTGALSSKKFSINSTYFTLSDTGTITSIATDGKKIVVDKGTITGYKSNGTVSARLEIGNGYFNIANGVLAIQGVVGVSGSTSFVKGISYESASLGNVVTALYSNTLATGVHYTSPSLIGSISGQASTFSGTFTGNAFINGSYTTISGSCSVTGTPQFTNSLAVSGGSCTATTQSYYVGTSALDIKEISYSKAVSASSGSINSQYGIIQSIS